MRKMRQRKMITEEKQAQRKMKRRTKKEGWEEVTKREKERKRKINVKECSKLTEYS